MNKTVKRILILLLTLAFATIAFTPAFAASNVPDHVNLPEQATTFINYVALGDSCAAGVRAVPGELPGWEDGSKYGYTDLIATWISKHKKVMCAFNEDYSISGNTAELLAGQTSTEDAQSILENADIVTITIGANDFLAPLYTYFDSIRSQLPFLDLEDPAVVQQILAGATAAIGECLALLNDDDTLLTFGNNMAAILSNVLMASPDAKIYVMGYYDPLPCLEEILQASYPNAPGYYYNLLNGMMNSTLNTAIQAAIAAVDPYSASVRYVPTMSVMNNGYWDYAYANGYLYYDSPYPYSDYFYDSYYAMADIHPTELGYEAIADVFKQAIAGDFASLHD
jgi:lysophospholipase L1-like esterase